MTTMNSIVTKSFEDVLFVPLECIHHNDSMSFVYLAGDNVKKIIEMGEANDNQAIILQGLGEDDKLMLSVPIDAEDWIFEGWDLFAELKEKRILEEKQREEDLEKFRLEMEKRRKEMDSLQKNEGNVEGVNPGMMFEMMRQRGGDRGGGRGRR